MHVNSHLSCRLDRENSYFQFYLTNYRNVFKKTKVLGAQQTTPCVFTLDVSWSWGLRAVWLANLQLNLIRELFVTLSDSEAVSAVSTDNMQNVSVCSTDNTHIVCLTIKLMLDMYLDEKRVLETLLKSSWLLETPWQQKRTVN